MDWKEWIGKRIFVQLKSGGVYTGDVVDVDDVSKILIFITIIDKFNDKITFTHSEILKIKEENK